MATLLLSSSQLPLACAPSKRGLVGVAHLPMRLFATLNQLQRRLRIQTHTVMGTLYCEAGILVVVAISVRCLESVLRDQTACRWESWRHW